jgi:hypothetical protein
MRAAAILIQKNWRAHAGRRNYLRMRTGYMRMQALIRSRILSHKFRHLRGHIVRLQARCRGYLIRRSVFEQSKMSSVNHSKGHWKMTFGLTQSLPSILFAINSPQLSTLIKVRMEIS